MDTSSEESQVGQGDGAATRSRALNERLGKLQHRKSGIVKILKAMEL